MAMTGPVPMERAPIQKRHFKRLYRYLIFKKKSICCGAMNENTFAFIFECINHFHNFGGMVCMLTGYTEFFTYHVAGLTIFFLHLWNWFHRCTFVIVLVSMIFCLPFLCFNLFNRCNLKCLSAQLLVNAIYCR